ncbi:regulatory protein RecX [Fulvivirga lutea]|uniref:Regulatory protein RecX n=1 Tax=Fulvivirga lutea TaxID=2810512 RepID=A0A974WHE9_9BACT|nr:regulatory protein RecX [Fulvivirga lutea]QSE98594.1 RecX family transcriptional regulator [Fulvivirga lutea]
MFSEEYEKPKRKLNPKEAKLKAADFCAYQERSQQQVRDKLYTYGLYSDDVEQILSELITENFINEERFAKAYAGGKFRIKKWGRNKILQGLNQHRVSNYCIKKAMEEIDEEDYQNTLLELIASKKSKVTAKDSFTKNRKVAAYLIQKGYEPTLVWDALKNED